MCLQSCVASPTRPTRPSLFAGYPPMHLWRTAGWGCDLWLFCPGSASVFKPAPHTTLIVDVVEERYDGESVSLLYGCRCACFGLHRRPNNSNERTCGQQASVARCSNNSAPSMAEGERHAQCRWCWRCENIQAGQQAYAADTRGAVAEVKGRERVERRGTPNTEDQNMRIRLSAVWCCRIVLQ